jgi:hypothetical protein
VKWTPGPWRTSSAFGWGAKPITIADDGEDTEIATICSRDNGDMECPFAPDEAMADANARLIAAAPEMFEALKAVNAIIAEGATEGFRPLVGDWADRLFYSQQATSDALRKATGGQ